MTETKQPEFVPVGGIHNGIQAMGRWMVYDTDDPRGAYHLQGIPISEPITQESLMECAELAAMSFAEYGSKVTAETLYQLAKPHYG